MIITYLITWVYLSAEIVQSSKSVANTLVNFSQYFIGVLNSRKPTVVNTDEQTPEPSRYLEQALTPREVTFLKYASAAKNNNAANGMGNGNQ